MLQPKFNLPAIVLVLALVSLITLLIPASAVTIPAIMLTDFPCLFIGFVAGILFYNAVSFSRQSTLITLIKTLNELASPFYKVMCFILPLRLNTRNEEPGAIMARHHEKPLPGLLLMHQYGVMKRFLEE